MVFAGGCAGTAPIVPSSQRCEAGSTGTQASDIGLRNQIAALTRRVDSLEDLAHPEKRRSAEWREFDEVGSETFWQRRFASEQRDQPWAAAVEPVVAHRTTNDANVLFRSIECRATLCRLEVTCNDPSSCTPRVIDRGHAASPNLGAVFCEPRADKSGTFTKIVFLFRQGRRMVPDGDP